MTATLLVQLRKGDEDAATLLETIYRPSILRLCVGYLGSPEEAEDAVQDVFAKVLATDTVPDAFRVWIYRIARNHCMNLLRDRHRRRDRDPLPESSRFGTLRTGFLTALVNAERQELVEQAFAQLTPGEQEALRLRYGEDLSRAEIAAVVDEPESTIKSRLFEGLKKLRERVE